MVAGGAGSRDGRAEAAGRVEREAAETAPGIDIDEAVDVDVSLPDRPPSPVTMEDLDRVIRSPGLMGEGVEVRRLGRREYSLRTPDAPHGVRVTTDPAYFEAHSDSVELWSPGHRLFPAGRGRGRGDERWTEGATLKGVLDEVVG